MTDQDPVIDLAECDLDTKCVDCEAPAAGRRRNVDASPSCLNCEADRLAMIQIIVEAADVEDGLRQALLEFDP